MAGVAENIRPGLSAFWGLLKASAVEWWNDNTFRLSASLAFYTIFSLAPVLLIAVSLASLIFEREAATRQVVGQLQGLVGPEGGAAIEQVLDAARDIGGSPLAVAVGIGTLIFGATIVFAELQAALNQIWDVESHPDRPVVRGLIRDRLLSFALALAVGFLLLVSLIISSMLAGAEAYLTESVSGTPLLWRTLNMITSFLVITALFAMIYKVLPDVNITWRDVAIGAVVTAILFSLGKYFIGLYLGQMAFGSAYGAAGSFVVLLIWIYYSALICFFGAEFTQVYARRYGSRIRPQPHAVRVGRKPDAV